MFRNIFKVGFRNISRHKGFSFINITGLTLGLTACLLIGLFVRDEKQFDKFIPEGDQVYRVCYETKGNEGTSYLATTPPMFATALQQDFPEVDKTLRLLEIRSKQLFSAANKKMYEERGVAADATFFEIFPLAFKYGTAANVLDDPTSIVLSAELAAKYFGNENPVGKQVLIDKSPFQVKGVFENNSKFHLPINYMLPMAAAAGKDLLESWEIYAFNTYVKVKPGTNVMALEPKFQNQIKDKINSREGDATRYAPLFQPLHDIHLYSSNFKYDTARRGNITYVKALTIIAIFILIIACFNFVNLATAKSLQRAKEVGVRKTIGASRKQLLLQFMGESVLLTFISIIISIGLTSALLPLLNDFTEKQILFDLISDPIMILLLLLLTLGVGIIAGFYPALVLSGFQPVKVLKGAISNDDNPGRIPWLRHALVVVQFSLSVLLIVSAIVVITQVNYLHNKDLGFNKEQILFFPMQGDNMFKNYESFKNELLQSPSISNVSIGYGFPGDMFGDGIMIKPEGGEKKCTQLMVDEDYIKTLGLQLLAGRDFSKDITTDKEESYIINETAVEELGYGTPEKALGQTLLWNPWRANDPKVFKRGQIIGVVKDFHYKSLYDKVEPAVLQIYPEAYWKVAVKMNTSGMENTLGHVKEVWNKFTPDYPIEYNFLDESFDVMYKAEDKLKSLLWIFTAITIFVACLGLFGLAAYAAERRRKEVGIRKVLGASVSNIMTLLSKDFLLLVMISSLIAFPIAGYFMKQWLQDFAYRIDIQWWMFAGAGMVALIIALLTVSIQAIRAAVANPVKSLKSE